MKVVHIITDLKTGGAEMMLYKLLEAGLHHESDTAVVSLDDQGSLGRSIEMLGIPVFALKMKFGLPALTGLMRLRQIVRRLKPLVLQGWMYHGNLAASVASCRSTSNSSVLWGIHHSLYDLNAEKVTTRWVINSTALWSRHVDAIVYCSRESEAQHKEIGYSALRSVHIPNGFDLGTFYRDPDAGLCLREELGIPRFAPVIGHVGRFHPMKDHGNFLQAAAKLAEGRRDVHFVMAGFDVTRDNPMLASLLNGSWASRVHLMGKRQDISALMNAMNIFTSSSWGEAFPMVLGEAMACGVPCVATAVGDSPYILGETGRIVPPQDPDSIVKAWIELLDMSPEARQKLGEAAQRRIIDKYSIQAVVQRYKSLYESVMNGEPGDVAGCTPDGIHPKIPQGG